MRERDGKPLAEVMTPEQFRHAFNADLVEKGFFETEIGHRIERFGNVAQVRSVYETRRAAGAPLLGRGVNYLLLYWDGTRWWITGAVWDDERRSKAAQVMDRPARTSAVRKQKGLLCNNLRFVLAYYMLPAVRPFL